MSDNDLNPLAATTRWDAESIADRIFRRDHPYPAEVPDLKLSNSLALAVEHAYGHLVVRAEAHGGYCSSPIVDLVITFVYEGRSRSAIITRENLALLHDEIFKALAAYDGHSFEIGIYKQDVKNRKKDTEHWQEVRGRFVNDICAQWDVLHPPEPEIEVFETSNEVDSE